MNYFLIIGAMKAGTTSLYYYLKSHPQIHASEKKEAKIFRDPMSPQQRERLIQKHLTAPQTATWAFEASTAYAKFPAIPHVPGQIREALPDARLIYMVRDPIERIWSQYKHNLAQGRETLGLRDAMEKDETYLCVSRYHLQLAQYLDLFPREQMLLLTFEEFIRDTESQLRRIYQFLELDDSPAANVDFESFNSSEQKTRASLALRVLRASPFTYWVPYRFRHWLKHSTGSSLPRRSKVITDDVYDYLLGQLADDVMEFRRTSGVDVENWPTVQKILTQQINTAVS